MRFRNFLINDFLKFPQKFRWKFLMRFVWESLQNSIVSPDIFRFRYVHDFFRDIFPVKPPYILVIWISPGIFRNIYIVLIGIPQEISLKFFDRLFHDFLLQFQLEFLQEYFPEIISDISPGII